jgi:hypothetical protein
MKILSSYFTTVFLAALILAAAISKSASAAVDCTDCECVDASLANCSVTETWHFQRGIDKPVAKDIYYRCADPISAADVPIDVRYASETEEIVVVDDDADVVVYAVREEPGDVTLEPPPSGGLEGNGTDGGLFERSNFYSRYRTHEY